MGSLLIPILMLFTIPIIGLLDCCIVDVKRNSVLVTLGS